MYKQMREKEIKFKGYETREGVGKPIGNSCYISIPKTWKGKRVAVVLLEPIDD
jgi:putative transposon-encoded protein